MCPEEVFRSLWCCVQSLFKLCCLFQPKLNIYSNICALGKLLIMRPEIFLNMFIIKVGRGWSEKASCLEEMMHKMILLVFRGTLTGWINGPTGMSRNSTKGNAKSCS